jgi:hypothetical protein
VTWDYRRQEEIEGRLSEMEFAVRGASSRAAHFLGRELQLLLDESRGQLARWAALTDRAEQVACRLAAVAGTDEAAEAGEERAADSGRRPGSD